MKIYGYCRISRKTQNIDRQVRNITALYPDAIILKEAFTGTKIQGRKELDKLLRVVKAGDKIVFDSVSRMSRNADEGCALYSELYQKGVILEFINEPTINTELYSQTKQLAMTGEDFDCILEGINHYFMILAEKQVRTAFEQAQKEVDDLHTRTAQGIQTARLNGKEVGRPKGLAIVTKKSITAKEQIKKYSEDFNGSLKDDEVIKLIGISRNSYYKYKRELRLEIAGAEE